MEETLLSAFSALGLESGSDLIVVAGLMLSGIGPAVIAHDQGLTAFALHQEQALLAEPTSIASAMQSFFDGADRPRLGPRVTVRETRADSHQFLSGVPP